MTPHDLKRDIRRDNDTVTVQIPFTIRKRGGRKVLIAPEGGCVWEAQRPRVDSAMVKALARAQRWRRMLETGTYASITEVAASEKINQSYVCRILRLTLLAPDIVETILDGRQPRELQLSALLGPFAMEWTTQRQRFLR